MTAHAESLVVGVDGSEESNAALLWAEQHAPAGATIHVLHAVSPVADLVLAAGAAPYTSVVDDDPTHALIHKTKTWGSQMIVVGRHGAGGCRTLGRVARGMLHELPVPVVFAAPPRAETTTAVGADVPDPDRVLVCVGYGQAAESALLWAAEFAATRHLPMELLHVVGYRPIVPLDSPSDMLASYLGGETSVDWALSELEHRAEGVKLLHPELAIVCRVERGSVVRRIVERADGAALVVLGQSHSGALTRHLAASRTLGVITQTHTSVAVVPA